MKKIAIVMAIFATFMGNAAFAQNNKSNGKSSTTGTGAQQGVSSSTGMAWGLGLGGLAVVGAVVGATVAGATSTSSGSTFSH